MLVLRVCGVGDAQQQERSDTTTVTIHVFSSSNVLTNAVVAECARLYKRRGRVRSVLNVARLAAPGGAAVSAGADVAAMAMTIGADTGSAERTLDGATPAMSPILAAPVCPQACGAGETDGPDSSSTSWHACEDGAPDDGVFSIHAVRHRSSASGYVATSTAASSAAKRRTGLTLSMLSRVAV
jgi:hypothetical protein